MTFEVVPIIHVCTASSVVPVFPNSYTPSAVLSPLAVPPWKTLRSAEAAATATSFVTARLQVVVGTGRSEPSVFTTFSIATGLQ